MKIIEYDPRNIQHIGNARGWFSPDHLTAINAYDTPLIDRTGKLDVGMEFHIIDPIPTGTSNKTFEEICSIEANRIKSLGRPVVVYWSGGIDSTLVLVEMLKADVADLTVVLTAASIVEYPLFYNNFIKGKLNVRRVRPGVISDIDPDELMVTGELGDQLMGSVLAVEYSGFDRIHTEDWRTYVRATCGEGFVQLIEPVMASAPFEIRTTFDYLWWLNFTCKWQHVHVRMGSLESWAGKFIKNVEHFYRGDEFQRWSMTESNHRQFKLGSTINSYKQCMKDIIADFTKDPVYQRDKLKVRSLKTHTTDGFLFKLEDGTPIGLGGSSSDVDLYESTFGKIYDELFRGMRNDNSIA